MIIFVLANSEDQDEMPHDAAYHLGLNYLPKWFPVHKGLSGENVF